MHECYYSANFVRLRPNTKEPFEKNWLDLDISFDDAFRADVASGGANVGILTGYRSNNLIDIDCDGPFTAELARILLPNTGAVFGRDSRPRCHYLYYTSESQPTVQFKHPLTKKVLIEIRANGSQTMFPGSTHPDGDLVRFEVDGQNTPSLVSFFDLHKCVAMIACGSILSECWVSGNRHNLALSFSALCARNSVSEETCLTITKALVEVMKDEECKDRLLAVSTTYADLAKGMPLTSNSDICECIGTPSLVKKIVTWLGGHSTIAPVRSISQDKDELIIDTSTDISCAEAFFQQYKDRVIYSDLENAFYHRSSDVYDQISVTELKGYVIKFLKGVTAISSRGRVGYSDKNSLSVGRVNAIVELSKPSLIRDCRRFDDISWLIGCQNGVIDLSERELTYPDNVITKRLGCRFVEDARCETFLSYLNSTFAGDRDVIEYLQRAIGYTLTGSTEAQVMFIASGSGANGKSVLLKALQKIMGDYGSALPSHSLTLQKFGNDRTEDLAQLSRKRFVFASEMEPGAKLATAKVKRLIAGDPMKVRLLYGNYFDMTPECKLWLACNDLPAIPLSDQAMWRRVHVIDFPVTFKPEERDPKLLDKLVHELPGILNWALEGVKQIGEMKGDFLAPPSKVQAALSNYQGSNDTVGDFLQVCCQQDHNSFITMQMLYDRYQSYTEISGIEPMSSISFGKELTLRGYEVVKKKEGNGRRGLKLN